MQPDDIFDNKEERQDFWIAITVLSLALLFIGFSSIKDTVSFDVPMNVLASETAETTNKVVPSVASFYREREVVEAVPSIDPISVDLVSKGGAKATSSITSDYEEEIDYSSVANEIPTKISDAREKIEATVSKVEEVIVESPKVVEQKVEEVIASEELPKQNVNTADLEIVPPTPVVEENASEECHISVGLFKEGNNVDKLVRRLKSQGFNVYTKRIARSTQVGVYVTCERTLAESILSEIQTNFAKDAFVEEFR